MLTCDKCGAKGFITLEGDEFHCHLCGFVWYLGREAGKEKKVIGPGLGGQRKKNSKRQQLFEAKEGTWPGAE
jgi:hypothetical protein